MSMAALTPSFEHEQSAVVEPVGSLALGVLNGSDRWSRATAIHGLGLVMAVDCFSQSVVTAVFDAANRRFEFCLGKTFGVAGREILGAMMGVMDEAVAARRSGCMQHLLKRIQQEAGVCNVGSLPTQNARREHLDYH